MGQASQLLNRLPFGPIVGAFFGLAIGVLIFRTPQWLFESAIASSGIADLVPAAKPPLGQTARTLVAIAIGLLTAGVIGVVCHFLEKKLWPRTRVAGNRPRGARINPTSPSPRHRAPIFAEQELGAPFMSDEAMEVAKNELVLESPIEAQEAVNPVAELTEAEPVAVEPEVALESVAEAPAPVTEPVHVATPKVAVAPVGVDDDASIAGLLDRLESALERRQARKSSGRPMPAGDIAALRKALGVAR